MRRLAAWAVCLLLCATLAAPAAAQTGGGLYEPFPGHVSKQRVRGFVARLPGGRRLASSLTTHQLAHGVVVSDSMRVAPSSGPSDRAGAGNGSLAVWLLPLLLLLPLPALLARR